MAFLARGALLEYSTQFLSYIPNLVLFQFNPESLNRTIEIPARPTGATSREMSQAGEVPVEKIGLTAYFSAADELGADSVLARAFGVSTRLAALEQMTRPRGRYAPGQLPDLIAGLLKKNDQLAQATPREKYPRVLFVWGPQRVLPVIIDSMSIVEQEYDYLLNPIRAEISLGLSVINPGPCDDDKVAMGALLAAGITKDLQVAANMLANGAQLRDKLQARATAPSTSVIQIA